MEQVTGNINARNAGINFSIRESWAHEYKLKCQQALSVVTGFEDLVLFSFHATYMKA